MGEFNPEPSQESVPNNSPKQETVEKSFTSEILDKYSTIFEEVELENRIVNLEKVTKLGYQHDYSLFLILKDDLFEVLTDGTNEGLRSVRDDRNLMNIISFSKRLKTDYEEKKDGNFKKFSFQGNKYGVKYYDIKTEDEKESLLKSLDARLRAFSDGTEEE